MDAQFLLDARTDHVVGLAQAAIGIDPDLGDKE